MRKSVFLNCRHIFVAVCCLIPLSFVDVSLVNGQATPEQLEPILSRQIQPPGITEFQLRQYLMSRVPPLRVPATSDEWTAEAKRLRKHLLDDIVFHGWPKEWVDAGPKIEDLGIIESGKGYRMR